MSSSSVEKIKDRLDIVEVVDSYIKLEKAGVNFKARCPFHNERTPSFFVSPNRQSYRCFGCGQTGDMFNFVQEIEGVDFKEALGILARKAGVEIEAYDGKKGDHRENLLQAIKLAGHYYINRLQPQTPVWEYLKDRGLTEKTIRAFGLGWAEADWQKLVTYLRSQKINDEVIVGSGLAIKSQKNGRVFDRFRSRLMFPLLDVSGRPVGFSGRLLDFSNQTQSVEAKYINTPQTDIYDKSSLLYGLNWAKQGIREHNNCLVVEGQMDLLMCHQAGWTNTVAISGTALTDKQVKTLGRLTDEIILAFDGDKAGQAAVKKSAEALLAAGLQVKALILPPGRDPADIIKEDIAEWRYLLDQADSIINFYLKTAIITAGQDKRQLGKLIKQEVYPAIMSIPSQVEKATVVMEVADKLQMPTEAIWQDLKELNFNRFTIKKEEEVTEEKEQLVNNPLQYFWAWWFWLETTTNHDFDYQTEARSLLEDIKEEDNLQANYEDQKEPLLFLIEEYVEKFGPLTKILWQEVVGRAHVYYWEQKRKQEEQKIGPAEKQEDQASVDKHLKRCQDITQTIAELRNQYFN
ncbi:MAG: DNA primase [Patescibacteria group bacterium]